MRADLVSFTDDDLATLANRGVVRRARREVEKREVRCDLEEGEDGTVVATWSDDVVVTLPAGASLERAQCTCPAEPPCRHVVRTVMEYGARVRSADVPEESVEHVASPVSDALVRKARKLFEEGLLFELGRAGKPIARCHSLGVTTRFLVPGDPHHAACDCGAPAPCEHAVMALWAFERLPEGETTGLVDTREEPYPVPVRALDAVSEVLARWTRVGLADAPASLRDSARRAEKEARKAGLVWVGDGLAELSAAKELYDGRDARFDAAELTRVVGELRIRHDVVRANRGTVPPVFVRGVPNDRVTPVGSARLVGLGCVARLHRTSASLRAFLQDEETGQVHALSRERPFRAADGCAQPIHELARASVAKGVTFAEAAMGRILAKGAKRSTSSVLSFGRAPIACHPQAYAWERLRAPVLAEGFGEIGAHLGQLPPRPLRPRRLAEDVHVAPVEAVEGVRFSSVTQEVVASLRDWTGATATLAFPFHASVASGAEALLRCLEREAICFVSGRFRRVASGLRVEPAALVFERDGVRRALFPWIEPDPGDEPSDLPTRPVEPELGAEHFLAQELADAMGEALVVGVEGWTPSHGRAFREHAARAGALGFVQVARWLGELAEAPTEERILRLAVLATWAEGREPPEGA